MSFSSPYFIFIFIPILLFLMFAAKRYKYYFRNTILLLIAISLAFYAVSSTLNLALLIFSILVNLSLAQISIRHGDTSLLLRRAILLVAIIYNLGVLVYFKFTLLNVNPLTISRDFDTATQIILPLGISFYSFQQISFQIDCYWRKVKQVDAKSYFLYVSFFPQLVAGPIVHHSEVIPQYENLQKNGFQFLYWKAAVVLFSIGLFKKTVIADSIGSSVDSVYTPLGLGSPIPFFDAWAAAFAFPLQIYFDFSGYSDMACALALLIGLKLPLNFNSPFKQTSLVDFWATWHMTLMRFFKDYIFTPLSFSLTRWSSRRRHGKQKMFLLTLALPVMIAFLLTGLWHGSGTSFLLFGLLHGFAITANHAWRYFQLPRINSSISWLFTMIFVCVSFVFLRVPNMGALKLYLSSLVVGELQLPQFLKSYLSPFMDISFMEITFGNGTFRYFDKGVVMIAFMMIVTIACLILPNSNQILWKEKTVVDHEKLKPPNFTLKFSAIWGIVVGVIFTLSTISIAYQTSDFIYFQF